MVWLTQPRTLKDACACVHSSGSLPHVASVPNKFVIVMSLRFLQVKVQTCASRWNPHAIQPRLCCH